MSGNLTVMVCAVEPSGDALGAALMAALKQRAPEIRFNGCGGPAMAAEGLISLFDIAAFSVMGPVDALKALPTAQRCARQLAEEAAKTQADAVIMIDSWAFSRLAAEKIRKAAPQAKLIKYVAPQVWASRPKRAAVLSHLFDGLITLFEFETPWFEEHGTPTVCAGHSGFQGLSQEPDAGKAFRQTYGLGEAPVVVLALGSRRAEIHQLTDRFCAAIDIVRRDHPTLRLVVPVAPGCADDIGAALEGWDAAPLLIGAEEKAAAFDAADAGLIASGTLSTELALRATPMVVAYRFGPITAAWGRAVVTTRWASLINIASGEEIIPEFVQEKCRPPAMAAALSELLTNPDARARQLDAFPAALARLGAGGPPAANKAAEAILSWIKG